LQFRRWPVAGDNPNWVRIPDSPTEDDLEGLQVGDFHCILVSGSEKKVPGTDVDGWVELDDGQRA